MDHILNKIYECLYYSDSTVLFYYITHLASLMRARLEPSGPQIKCAILISCLLDQSGASSRRSDTPNHTWYSLKSGTLDQHTQDNSIQYTKCTLYSPIFIQILFYEEYPLEMNPSRFQGGP